ncbi:unnamed protein product [Camellia sinensis]
MGLKIPIRWAALSPNQLRSVEGEDPDSNINNIARIESHVFFAPFLHSLHRRVVGSQLAANSPFLGDSASQFVQKMRTLLIATEESHFLLRLFKCSILTLDSIKDCIAQSFADIFCGKSNIDFFDERHDGVLPCALQDIIETVGDQCQQQNKDCFSQRKDCNDKRDLRAVFNVLDTMLKDSLERLKTMREGISWAHIGLCGRTFEGSYTQHVAIIRALCLEEILQIPFNPVLGNTQGTSQPTLLEKDHATLQNPWSTCGNHNLSPPPPKSLPAVHQESTSDTLEETDKINPDTSEEAQILADLLEANGVNKLFDKLEAPFASSGLLLGTSSNEAATHIQKGLTISLQSMTDVNGMIAVANNVFMILKSLGVDFISFYEKVKIFLGCFALKTQLADSSNLSIAEFEAQYCEKKLHFDKVSGEHEQLSASIIKSDEQIAGLNQRIIQTKELLKQLEEELSSTQAEHAVILHKLPRVFLNQKKTSKLL